MNLLKYRHMHDTRIRLRRLFLQREVGSTYTDGWMEYWKENGPRVHMQKVSEHMVRFLLVIHRNNQITTGASLICYFEKIWVICSEDRYKNSGRRFLEIGE